MTKFEKDDTKYLEQIVNAFSTLNSFHEGIAFISFMKVLHL